MPPTSRAGLRPERSCCRARPRQIMSLWDSRTFIFFPGGFRFGVEFSFVPPAFLFFFFFFFFLLVFCFQFSFSPLPWLSSLLINIFPFSLPFSPHPWVTTLQLWGQECEGEALGLRFYLLSFLEPRGGQEKGVWHLWPPQHWGRMGLFLSSPFLSPAPGLDHFWMGQWVVAPLTLRM
jgi:hypothetical protein